MLSKCSCLWSDFENVLNFFSLFGTFLKRDLQSASKSIHENAIL